ncbi:efflux RND transporter periplasmic adaptor subunit [Pandoraea sp.]|uniref:HlyD family secretion protein n=1 Tax=Pandoraea sp. TaxID=1883445 RepID=UPI001228AE97|nr:efflux RND transporter periplasmic adaptor subunit [Pandoraea sp.]TAL52330.1 MAG: HlyD family efflux transporter periplasmic adaptor subunit [Pandoraea sp.]TAM16140.1 MAG: HlyD family efflux transporter periplasmic adaptor subunit [Pandoraea sp.]
MSDNQQGAAAQPAPAAATGNNGKRKRMMLTLSAVIIVAAIGYGLYWGLYARYYESTDDAYVSGNVVQITPQVGGTVTGVNADDTQMVQAGQTLVQLDQADSRVALLQAEANLAQTVRQVRTLYVDNQALAATVAMREADLAKARADLQRREIAMPSGAVSREELGHAQDAVKTVEAALAVARSQLMSNHALTDKTTVATHPQVRQAADKLRAVYLDYARTSIPAPVAGYVAKRAVQVGQRVAPGTPLMAIVPLNQVWVDANFKEVQIAHMRVGQPVEMTADVYGSSVKFHGTVAGFSAGTGSAFSLLPAQNATGNWIKVVQRLPVRIALDPKELAKHPLRIGLSMQVEVDVHNTKGKALGNAPAMPTYQTDVFEKIGHQADAIVARIIEDNLGAHASADESSDKPAKAKLL